jgi:hypothetical protein
MEIQSALWNRVTIRALRDPTRKQVFEKARVSLSVNPLTKGVKFLDVSESGRHVVYPRASLIATTDTSAKFVADRHQAMFDCEGELSRIWVTPIEVTCEQGGSEHDHPPS